MNFLVITTINPPTEAIRSFANIPGWKVVVVGDQKTPKDWKLEGVDYLSIEEQEYLFPYMSLPYNHYSRKMIGYLYAMREGAEVIAETDDDNFPYPEWCFPDTKVKYDLYSKQGFVNIYKRFCFGMNIWPRGLPWKYIDSYDKVSTNQVEPDRVGIWQGLADLDPDVDAIYRMIVGFGCVFRPEQSPLVLDRYAVSPFNSQNTLFKKALYPLMYLPVTVPQRFSDILRSYVAQPIMWDRGYLLGFSTATVKQNRNPHDLMDDFRDELSCYLSSETAFNVALRAIKPGGEIEANMCRIYKALEVENIVSRREVDYLYKWLHCTMEEV